MTAREVFEGMLIELSKVKAPSLLLEDFNYLFNKTIRLYTERQYDVYDTNQKTTDTLRVLKATALLTPEKTEAYNEISVSGDSYLSKIHPGLSNLYGNTYEVVLPSDYLHMLNFICIYKVKKNYKCYNAGSYVSFAASRLDSDKWGQIINDYYNRPLPTRPYYFIHNVNKYNEELTNPYSEEKGSGTDQLIIESEYGDNGQMNTESENSVKYSDTITIKNLYSDSEYDMNVREQPAGSRHVNPTSVRCEIRYGKDDSIFELEKISIDYLKAPQKIRLTPELMDLTEDTSQILEFPDFVCQLIINELVMHVMENTADPRLQTNMSVNQTTMVSSAPQLTNTAAASA